MDLFISCVTGVLTAVWRVAADRFNVPWAIHQRLSLFASEFAHKVTRSLDKPAQNLSPLRIAWNPFWHISWTPGWVLGSCNILCKYIYDDFSYRWCPVIFMMLFLSLLTSLILSAPYWKIVLKFDQHGSRHIWKILGVSAIVYYYNSTRSLPLLIYERTIEAYLHIKYIKYKIVGNWRLLYMNNTKITTL